jgi:hypothetical protein
MWGRNIPGWDYPATSSNCTIGSLFVLRLPNYPITKLQNPKHFLRDSGAAKANLHAPADFTHRHSAPPLSDSTSPILSS